MADIELATLRKECMTSLYLCADNVIKHLENDRDTEFTRLRSYAEDYSMLEMQQKLADEALETAKKDIDLSDVESIEDKFQSNMNMLMAKRYKRGTHAYVLELDKKIAKVNKQSRENANDSDLTITESQEQFIDPITKKPIQDPVKNTVCGHVYERESILKLISLKSKTRCPVAGCGNRGPILENHLLSDEELTFRATLHKHSTMIQEGSIMDLENTM